jgi:nitrogen fixation/metabolism regulation signal transduction histidine kinase
MVARSIKKAALTVFAATGVGLVLVALFLLSRTAQNSDDFDRLHNVILSINIAGVIVLFILLVGNLARLLREYRTHVPGAKLKARIVGMFVGLAVLPLWSCFISRCSLSIVASIPGSTSRWKKVSKTRST